MREAARIGFEMKKKVVFHRAEQLVKPGKYYNLYDGVIIEKSKDKITMVCVDKDEKDVDVIDMDPNEYKFKVITLELAKQSFQVALLNQENQLNESKKDLIRSQRSYDYALSKFKEYFNDPSNK